MTVNTEKILSSLNRPVAVFGNGVSGRAIGRLLKHIGVDAEFYDTSGTGGASKVFTDFHVTRHELVIYSPGFPLNHQWIQSAYRKGIICLGEMDFASIFWKGKIVAITGTNGKTSLTKFLTEAMRLNGLDAFAVGNIGMPLSQLIPDLNNKNAIAVCEVSSFQSERMNHFKPDTVLWTNMSSDHLDRHNNLTNYFDAKYW
jgi:UDP-N-acetylmuramoylalanine--D-glutamate ligase